MEKLSKWVFLILALALAVPGAVAKAAPAESDRAIVIVPKDGKPQTFAFADIARIEFNDGVEIVFKNGRRREFHSGELSRIEFTSAAGDASKYGREAHFLGTWKVGIGGDNSGTFLITLKPDGIAKKSIGDVGGKWTVVNGEARCSWDDGWTDVIRKVNGRWQKAAYSAGTFPDGEPASVADAVYLEPN